jgi:hypothetical protein
MSGNSHVLFWLAGMWRRYSMVRDVIWAGFVDNLPQNSAGARQTALEKVRTSVDRLKLCEDRVTLGR